MKKVAKINLRITAKTHAHRQTLSKTHEKIQKDPAKILVVAFTRVDIFCVRRTDR